MNVVFGYGSLACPAGQPCVLREHRRGWGVAMDNRRTIPGYKFYVDPATGARPDVFVTFLCVWPEPGASVEGVVFEVDDAGLDALDRRERNYDRHDVSAHVDVDGPVWAYLASDAGRERFATGHAAGTAVVSEEYLARVPGVEPPELPVLPLVRRDVGA